MLAEQMKMNAEAQLLSSSSRLFLHFIGYAEESNTLTAMVLLKIYIIAVYVTCSRYGKNLCKLIESYLEIISGKEWCLVDDSLVRSATSKILAEILRKAGLRNTLFRPSIPAEISCSLL